MLDILHQLLLPDPLQGLLSLVAACVLYLLLGILPVIAGLYLIYYLLTLPMRRNERARLFLDLLELGLDDGRTPEGAVLESAASKDSMLGRRFQKLAGFVSQGMRLGRALDQVPRLLAPPQVAMLKAGERIGDVGKVLPACRLQLRDGVSQVRGALNYLIVLAFVTTPFMVAAPIVLRIGVLPSFAMVFEGMLAGSQLPPFTRLVLGQSGFAIVAQAALLLLVWLLTLAYLGGPRLRSWLELTLPGGGAWLDKLHCRLPWRRKRLERDFSAMLSILLEAGVPEPESVQLAAESTGNAVFIRHARSAVARLQQGVKLPDAIQLIDDTGELHWRLANALRGAGFVRALSAWHEALDAKAFQLEQGWAQVATTILVLLNGVIVGGFVIGLFMALIRIINEATLW